MKSHFEVEANSVEKMYIQALASDNPDERYQTVRKIKNMAIGMKCKKTTFVEEGLIERLLELMVQADTTIEFAVEATVILGSLTRGEPEVVDKLMNSQAVPILCKGLCHEDERLVIACLRSLSRCFISKNISGDLIYENANIITKLVYLLTISSQTAEYVTNILKITCKTTSDQTTLFDANIISALVPWLNKKQVGILVPVLECLSAILHGNEMIANEVLDGDYHGVSIEKQLINLISSDRPDEVQLAAADCLTKALCISTTEKCTVKLERKILNVFVRLCQKDKPLRIRISAANGLAYLIEEDNELQAIAAISNHLIKNISSLLSLSSNKKEEVRLRAKEAALKVFASLSANDEKVRKQIVDNCSKLMDNIHQAINQNENVPLQAAALQCLLSLSRSVQQLRTTFQDVKIWQPVITALKTSTSDDIISVSSSVLCNLLLEFSPCKDGLIDFGALDVLVALIKRNEIPLQINGIWGIMNLAYDANEDLKNKIVEVAGIHNILSLLDSSDVDVAVKALGVLRNLLTEKEQDIDNLMNSHGKEILQAVKPLALNDHLNERIKEQVLCLLSNIANGCFAKNLLMEDLETISKVISYISSNVEHLQVASVFCVTNLMRSTGNPAEISDRKVKLRELGAEKQLQTLLTTPNSNLFDRVKQALQKFT